VSFEADFLLCSGRDLSPAEMTLPVLPPPSAVISRSSFGESLVIESDSDLVARLRLS